ncbi:hypothetical protein GDO78_004046 [Eleutherodactylus coqui]|uniref:Uncharacterized protein n=1 Tax=Eleutherodactylus coqui TaxID=57060 RepID=A0A8J6JZ82_ELECQ|nr:hypothetical protein GDO78_004046 [Eleutherodactylus coqui]
MCNCKCSVPSLIFPIRSHVFSPSVCCMAFALRTESFLIITIHLKSEALLPAACDPSLVEPVSWGGLSISAVDQDLCLGNRSDCTKASSSVSISCSAHCTAVGIRRRQIGWKWKVPSGSLSVPEMFAMLNTLALQLVSPSLCSIVCILCFFSYIRNSSLMKKPKDPFTCNNCLSKLVKTMACER